jgi:hypothetical protein
VIAAFTYPQKTLHRRRDAPRILLLHRQLPAPTRTARHSAARLRLHLGARFLRRVGAVGHGERIADAAGGGQKIGAGFGGV